MWNAEQVKVCVYVWKSMVQERLYLSKVLTPLFTSLYYATLPFDYGDGNNTFYLFSSSINGNW